jgi:hypothetical protein
MAREAVLFDAVKGSVLDAYLVLEPGKTVGPLWIENARSGRKKLEKELGKLMKGENLDAVKPAQGLGNTLSQRMLLPGIARAARTPMERGNQPLTRPISPSS